MESTTLCSRCRDLQLNSALDELEDGGLEDLFRIPHDEFFSYASSCHICSVAASYFRNQDCSDVAAVEKSEAEIIISIRKHGKSRRLIYFNTFGWTMANFMVWASQDPLIDPDPISYKSLYRMRSWISHCDKNHTNCKKVEPEFMPTRLLEVDASAGSIRLVLSANPQDRYAALSHCWGEIQPLTTTSQNFASFQLGIPISSLPQSFADAVQVTRLLGIPYLWIDSLCIIQGDPDDWFHESATMASVYGNADVTIIASRAASSTAGVLSLRHETYITKREQDTSTSEVTLYLVKRDYYDNYVSSFARSHPAPLDKRAWAIQERHLSHRKIFFGEAQMLWECKEMTQSEDKQLEASNSKTELSWMSPAWYEIVELFTACDITHESDTLPAISGIARTTAERTGQTYCGGIWLDQLCNGLLWYPYQNGPTVIRKTRRNCYVAPTFSWAASKGPVWYRALSKGVMSGRLCTYVAHDQTLRAGSSDIFGQLEWAWIRLGAPLIKVLRQLEGIGESIRVVLQLQSGKKYVIPALLDHHDAGIPTDTFLLLMYQDETRMQALVLAHTPVLGEHMAFRRIGICWIPSNQFQKVNWWGRITDIEYADREAEMEEFVRLARPQNQTVMLI